MEKDMAVIDDAAEADRLLVDWWRRPSEKESLEWLSVLRFIRAPASQDWVAMPCKVSKRERPDFEITYGSKAVGVECTLATWQRYREVAAAADRHPTSRLLHMSPDLLVDRPASEHHRHFFDGGVPPAKLAPGFLRDEAELRLIEAIQHRVHVKSRRLPTYDYVHRIILIVTADCPVAGTTARILADATLRDRLRKLLCARNVKVSELLLDFGHDRVLRVDEL